MVMHMLSTHNVPIETFPVSAAGGIDVNALYDKSLQNLADVFSSIIQARHTWHSIFQNVNE